jgi:hypothetical protein
MKDERGRNTRQTLQGSISAKTVKAQVTATMWRKVSMDLE